MMARGDRAAARLAFEEATEQSPQIGPAQLQLALMFDEAGQIDAAIERYRRAVASEPNNVLALNNLAYRLAVDKKALGEALRLAERAVKLSPQTATVLDTLAWTQHLLGDNESAAKTMAAALNYAPNQAEIRLHAATIYAAAGARAVAEDQLKVALKLKPALESSAEVKQLRQQLSGSPASK
jgi:Tfp pilus assembly protein PilF